MFQKRNPEFGSLDPDKVKAAFHEYAQGKQRYYLGCPISINYDRLLITMDRPSYNDSQVRSYHSIYLTQDENGQEEIKFAEAIRLQALFRASGPLPSYISLAFSAEAQISNIRAAYDMSYQTKAMEFKFWLKNNAYNHAWAHYDFGRDHASVSYGNDGLVNYCYERYTEDPAPHFRVSISNESSDQVNLGQSLVLPNYYRKDEPVPIMVANEMLSFETTGGETIGDYLVKVPTKNDPRELVRSFFRRETLTQCFTAPAEWDTRWKIACLADLNIQHIPKDPKPSKLPI